MSASSASSQGKGSTLKLVTGKKIRRLFFDIETSPNVGFFWRPGFKISLSPESILSERAIICLAYKWQGDPKVHYLKWTKSDRNPFVPGDDRAILERFVPIIESAVEVVAHHGDKFDIPWLRARAAIHRLPMSPFIKTIDTKAQSSRGFYFNSNKLDYLAQVSGIGKKKDTGYDLWKDVMRGDKGALARMIDYCQHDVVLLEQVYLWLEEYNKPKTHYGVMVEGTEKWACPRCASGNVKRTLDEVTASGVIQVRMRCLDCRTLFKISNTAAKKRADFTRDKKQCSQCFEWLPENEENFRYLPRRGHLLAECRSCEVERKAAA